MKEWARAANRPQNREELFNLRHSSLRNVIERVFGVLKKRFPILEHMPSYPIETQIKLIKCCFMMHNFIRHSQLYEDEFYSAYDNEAPIEDSENNEEDEVDEDLVKYWRDSIAQTMWDSYVLYLASKE